MATTEKMLKVLNAFDSCDDVAVIVAGWEWIEQLAKFGFPREMAKKSRENRLTLQGIMDRERKNKSDFIRDREDFRKEVNRFGIDVMLPWMQEHHPEWLSFSIRHGGDA